MFGSLGEKCYLRGVDRTRDIVVPHLNTKTIFNIYGQILKQKRPTKPSRLVGLSRWINFTPFKGGMTFRTYLFKFKSILMLHYQQSSNSTFFVYHPRFYNQYATILNRLSFLKLTGRTPCL